MKSKRVLSFIAFFSVIVEVSAYIDPGTAGTIIGGSIWPFIIGIFAVIGAFFSKFLIGPVKKAVLGIWKKIRRN